MEITRSGGILYELAFGDVDHEGSFNVQAITNNGDIIKLFATLFQILKYYLKKYPNRVIAFTGSTASRTRLYRIIIGSNLNAITEKYVIFGVRSNGLIEPFKRDNRYLAFLLKNKRPI